MNLQPNESIKLTKKMLETASYQFVTKAYKVITGKSDFIGKKKSDLIPKIKGKTYTEPEPIVVNRPKQPKSERYTTPLNPVQTMSKMERLMEDWKERKAKAFDELRYHSNRDTLKKIVTPLLETVEAAWNMDINTGTFFKPALFIGEKLIVLPEQQNVPDGYVKVSRSHEKCGKFVEILSVRHFRNLNEPDYSEMEKKLKRKFSQEFLNISQRYD